MAGLRLERIVVAAALLAGGGGCGPGGEARETSMLEQVRGELEAEPAGTDAAVILAEAMRRARRLPADERPGVLREALKQAGKARRFRIPEESPLPAGWPKPSLPGLVRLKTYPASRSAWVRDPNGRNGRFAVLFRHIKDREIAMTAPVVMEYSPEAAAEPAKAGSSEAMAFLYRHAEQGEAGRFGPVEVENAPPLEVVSVGTSGPYTKGSVRKGLAKLGEWLKEHTEWRQAGPPRVLAYNSPLMPFWKKYSEVQIPVEPQEKKTPPAMPLLSDEEKRVLLRQGTERPFSGKYWDHFAPGLYVCRQCGAELYKSASKFRSDCGWPSFDDEIDGAVKRRPDADGRRTEIVCAACGGHLGHVFEGEGLTAKNVRHCVNSISLVFSGGAKPAAEQAIFAGGCFWGVEHLFEGVKGVLSVTSGYTGGKAGEPTYEQVCTGKTGHAEAVRVVFDPNEVSYRRLARLFFEIHDPTQKDRQGPDVGTQYRSAVFYRDADQKKTAEELIRQLRAKGYDVVTQVVPASQFHPAEEYHQDYLKKHPNRPVCHERVRRFDVPAGK